MQSDRSSSPNLQAKNPGLRTFKKNGGKQTTKRKEIVFVCLIVREGGYRPDIVKERISMRSIR